MRNPTVWQGTHPDKRKKPKEGDLRIKNGYLSVFTHGKWKRVK